jgi:methyltransferase (TIGR00027 family)
LPDKLDEAGFEKDRLSLFVLEGLLMYLDPESVRATLRIIGEYAGTGSRLVFDYVRSSVLRHENTLYGEAGLARSVSRAGEQWRFGLEPGEVASFAAAHGFGITDHKCVRELEASYFTDGDGRLAGRVNGTHCIVTAERRR